MNGESMTPDGGTETQLERTLGLTEALMIGVGTMIGAGIFVLPGPAADVAGPAIALSFLIGGVIALLTALSASELATAMPRAGVSYYFIDRGGSVRCSGRSPASPTGSAWRSPPPST